MQELVSKNRRKIPNALILFESSHIHLANQITSSIKNLCLNRKSCIDGIVCMCGPFMTQNLLLPGGLPWSNETYKTYKCIVQQKKNQDKYLLHCGCTTGQTTFCEELVYLFKLHNSKNKFKQALQYQISMQTNSDNKLYFQ